MKIPTREQCFKLLEKYGTLPNILDHSIMVNKIANYLAFRLKKKGIKVNLELVDRGSLLHDIAKSKMVKEKVSAEKEQHHIDGENILIEEGFPEVGRLVRMHSSKEIHNLKTWEEKIINYADTRVRHDQIVSVRERLDDLYVRYDVPDHLKVDEKYIFNLEKEIFDTINESPDILKEVIE